MRRFSSSPCLSSNFNNPIENNNIDDDDIKNNNLIQPSSLSKLSSPEPSTSGPPPLHISSVNVAEEEDNPQYNHRHPTIGDPNEYKFINNNNNNNNNTIKTFNNNNHVKTNNNNNNDIHVDDFIIVDQQGSDIYPYSSLCVEDLLSAFQGLVDAVVVCNGHSVVLGVNEAASTMFGYRARELLGEKVIRLVDAASLPQDDINFSLNILQTLKHLTEDGLTSEESYQVRGVRKDGKRFPLAVKVCEVRARKNQSQALFVLQLHDASATVNRKKIHRSDSSSSASRYKTEFKEIGKLGSGGFGKVYRAINRLDGAEYAVKKVKLRHTVQDIRNILEQTADAETPANKKSGALKVLREVKTMARIANHPNVVRYFNCWIEASSASRTNSSTTMTTPTARTPRNSSVFKFGNHVYEEERNQSPFEQKSFHKEQFADDSNQTQQRESVFNSFDNTNSITNSEKSSKIDNEELDTAIFNGWPSLKDPFRDVDEELAQSPHQEFMASGGHHNLVFFDKKQEIPDKDIQHNKNFKNSDQDKVKKEEESGTAEEIEEDEYDTDISTESSSVPSILYVGSQDDHDFSFSGPGSWSNHIAFSHRSPPRMRPGNLTTSTSASLSISNRVNRRTSSSPEYGTPTPSSLPRSPVFFMMDGDDNDNEEEQKGKENKEDEEENQHDAQRRHWIYQGSEDNITDKEHLESLSNKSDYHSDASTENTLTPYSSNNRNEISKYKEKEDEKNHLYDTDIPSSINYNYTNQLDEVFQFEEAEEPSAPFQFSVTESRNTSNNSSSAYNEDEEETESSNNTVTLHRSRSSSFSNPAETSQDTENFEISFSKNNSSMSNINKYHQQQQQQHHHHHRNDMISNENDNNTGNVYEYNYDADDDKDNDDDNYNKITHHNKEQRKNRNTSQNQNRRKPEPIHIPEANHQRIKKEKSHNKYTNQHEYNEDGFEEEEEVEEGEEGEEGEYHREEHYKKRDQHHRSHPSKDHAILYIQMEFCESDTLREWLHREDRVVSYEENMPIFIQIVSGLHHIHSKGFIHRDIKPPNIFVNSNNVKIGDFGLAKNFVAAPLVPVEGGGNTPHGKGGMGASECDTPHSALLSKHVHRRSSFSQTADVGTHLYASPEQLEGGLYNAKVDIFSLGIVLFEMFNKFSTGMERVQVLTAFKEAQVVPEEMKEKFPEAAQLVIWLTNPDPKQRPTAQQILESEFVRRHVEPESRELSTCILPSGKNKLCKGCTNKEATIAKLLKENEEYSCKIEDQQETISRLRLQLLELRKYVQ